MGSNDQMLAESAWLYRLFALGPARVSLIGETIHIEGLLGDVLVKIPVDSIGLITVRPSWFWHRLTIRLTDGTERSIGGLDRSEAERLRDAVRCEEAARVGNASKTRGRYWRRVISDSGALCHDVGRTRPRSGSCGSRPVCQGP